MNSKTIAQNKLNGFKLTWPWFSGLNNKNTLVMAKRLYFDVYKKRLTDARLAELLFLTDKKNVDFENLSPLHRRLLFLELAAARQTTRHTKHAQSWRARNLVSTRAMNKVNDFKKKGYKVSFTKDELMPLMQELTDKEQKSGARCYLRLSKKKLKNKTIKLSDLYIYEVES